MYKYLSLLLFLAHSFLVSSHVIATEFSPWLGKDYEVETRAECLYQSYRFVDCNHGRCQLRSNDFFYNFSASFCGSDYSAELETTFANTHQQRPACDNIRLTGRYRLFNDITDEEAFTVTPGITLIQAFNHSVDDISSFHHGKLEGELHLAIGKEIPMQQFWRSHTWVVVGIGCADQGSPWVRGNFYYERNWWDRHQVRWSLHTLWGLGHNNLETVKHFRGYGSIRHQSIDLGVRYNYLFDCGVTFGLQYARRLYARNFPEQVNLVTANIFYPFGI